jgi:hypothetical protein
MIEIIRNFVKAGTKMKVELSDILLMLELIEQGEYEKAITCLGERNEV